MNFINGNRLSKKTDYFLSKGFGCYSECAKFIFWPLGCVNDQPAVTSNDRVL